MSTSNTHARWMPIAALCTEDNKWATVQNNYPFSSNKHIVCDSLLSVCTKQLTVCYYAIHVWLEDAKEVWPEVLTSSAV